MSVWRGQVVVLTGASLGIGAEVAHALATQSARLVLAARDVARPQDVAEMCRRHGTAREVMP